MKHTKAFLITAAFITVYFSTFAITAAASTKSGIEGVYNCAGHDPFANINYHGRTTVKKTGATYNFKWDFGKKMIYEGTGIFNTSENTLIAVLFSNPDKPKYTGVQLYKVKSDGSLIGNWTIKGQRKIGTEICKKIS